MKRATLLHIDSQFATKMVPRPRFAALGWSKTPADHPKVAIARAVTVGLTARGVLIDESGTFRRNAVTSLLESTTQCMRRAPRVGY